MINFKSSLLLGAIALTSCSQNQKEAPTPISPLSIQQTASGLKHKLLRPGKGGRTPNSLSTVTAHYEGRSLDGVVFDSSYKRGEPSEFPLDQVISGWTEGLQLMTRGEKRRFWIPARMAYGTNPGAGKPAGDLIFDIELIDFHQ